MEPLEIRIARLAPEQQREVRDFVDFLLFKKNLGQPPANSPSSLIMVTTPPVMAPDPEPVHLPVMVPATDLFPCCDPSSPVLNTDPQHPLIQEIGAVSDDGITSDFMDYGKFETQPSPTTEAVKKVRQKIIARQEKDKPGHLLDWVD